jgi:uncharacterized protein YqjF (DUF2071 family)
VKPFLTAQWRDLAMLNWPIDPALLAPRVPAGTELDLWSGACYVSLVAFRFLDTRVRGLAIPGHRDFEEINLRFYVRRRAAGEERRGVVFIKEIVPRFAIAFVARTLYEEPYVALPTSSAVRDAGAGRSARYEWREGGRAHWVALDCAGPARSLAAGSRESFIAEHYWGYTARRAGGASEYRVAHPAWSARDASRIEISADFARLYGPELSRVLSVPPEFSFLAEGSAVEVYPGERLR